MTPSTKPRSTTAKADRMTDDQIRDLARGVIGGWLAGTKEPGHVLRDLCGPGATVMVAVRIPDLAAALAERERVAAQMSAIADAEEGG